MLGFPWTVIELDRPSGRRVFRFSDERRNTGRPVRVEVHRDGRWRPCPNFDVSDAIMAAINAGYVGIKMGDE